MRTLVIESTSEACSAALFEDGNCLAHFHEVIGRGHAERLVPAIAALPGKGQAERILVSVGPGSFTGVRIGLAAARALGLAWGAQVLGYPTHALVAAAVQRGDAQPVTVCMNGGHGEWFMQDFAPDGLPQAPVSSLTPEAASDRGCHAHVAGNRASQMADTQAEGIVQVLDILPDARHAMSLHEDLLTTDLSPVYGRAPDARLPGVVT